MAQQDGSGRYGSSQLSIVLFGDVKVGKTSLLFWFSEGTFTETYQPGRTAYTDLYKSSRTQVDGQPVELLIGELGVGMERTTTNPHSGQHCYFVTFDITNMESFNLVSKLLEEINRYSRPYTTVVIVGNKSDLAQQRVVSREQAEKLAKDNSLAYHEVSAKTGDGTKELLSSSAAVIKGKLEEIKKKRAASGKTPSAEKEGRKKECVLV